MRVYQLADVSLRECVNLTIYEDIITGIIHSIVPSAKVIVEADRYLIKGELTKGEAIRIGKAIAQSELGQFCLQRAILFVGHNMPQKVKYAERKDMKK